MDRSATCRKAFAAGLAGAVLLSGIQACSSEPGGAVVQDAETDSASPAISDDAKDLVDAGIGPVSVDADAESFVDGSVDADAESFVDGSVDADAESFVDASIDAPDSSEAGPICTLCNGECVDPSTSTSHCGRCGHGCLGGTCAEGRCLPSTVVANASAVALVEDQGSLYWATLFGEIRKSSVDGSGEVALATSTDFMEALVVTSSEAVYSTSDGSSASVKAVPKTGGPSRTIVRHDGYMYVTSISAASDRVVYTTASPDERTLNTVGFDGTGVQQIANGVANQPLQVIGSDETNFYWIAARTFPSTAIEGKPLLGGATFTVTLIDHTPSVIGSSVDALFWSGAQALWTVPKSGGTTVQIAHVSGHGASAVVVFGGFLYWTTRETGLVRRVPVAGGTIELLAGNENAPSQLVVRSDALYWVEATNGGKIRRLAMPQAP